MTVQILLKVVLGGVFCLGLLQLRENVERSGELLVDIMSIQELDPVDIQHPVPTGPLTIKSVEGLNLPVWARDVTQATISAVKKAGSTPSRHLAEISHWIEAMVDPDLAVHVCYLNETVPFRPTEDHNCYLDLRLAFEGQQGSDQFRAVVAEDAARAVNRPLSFNVLIQALRVAGRIVAKGCIGANLTPRKSAACLDRYRLEWANGSLVEAVVATTTKWPWQNCAPRTLGANRGGEDQDDFQGAIRNAITGLQPGLNLTVKFDTSAIEGLSGVVMMFTYSLCGHLMAIPLTVESGL
eukprot:TRINITY_DN4066_c0_g1_i1.p1 TRINITY_DN4066_c0_g1~~TRINITY_DN4066_c0_g1_i1.p1  ORF type:complete len:296 (+),score=35.50 TRINITY_DN4066_c0_g1_i1:45-932(+)